MREAILELLTVKSDDFDGLFTRVPNRGQRLTDLIETHFYYVRFRDGSPRELDLLDFLASNIVPYCLRRSDLTPEKLTPTKVRKLYLKAKNSFQNDNTKTGEAGELLAYTIIEGYLQAPKIITKMALKTNRAMPIHGSDGVHLHIDGSGGVYLHFAEAKMYGKLLDAIRSALESVHTAVSQGSDLSSALDDEIELIESNLDIPSGPLREFVSGVLNPWSKLRDNLKYCHTCIIGFDIPPQRIMSSAGEVEVFLQELADTIECYLLRKIREDPLLPRQRWCVFFIPFTSVQKFRESFLKMLSA